MSAERETQYEVEDIPREECGVFAVARIDSQVDSARDIPLAVQAYQAILGLQHRGEDGAGISVFSPGDQAFITCKDKGLITDVFGGGRYLDGFPDGSIALAHTRYGTGKKSGDAAESARQAHPLGGKDSKFMLAMNGHIKGLENRRGLTDTEHLVEIIDRRMHETGDDFRTSFLSALRDLDGGYSIVATDGSSLLAARDPWGFRPLSQLRTDKHHYFISEDSALDPLRGADPQLAEEVEPGMLWTVPLDGGEAFSEEIYPVDKPTTCSMEFAYFARPDSSLHGRNIQQVRMKIGEVMARSEDPDIHADIVFGVPDSGVDTAIGFSNATGIPFVRAITKNPYVGRTFILADQELRAATSDLKLHVSYPLVEGKDCYVFDDSVVRGTNARVYVKKIWAGKPKSVHMRIAFPPHIESCHYGIDTGNRSELIARNKDLEQMRKYFGVTTLRFITVEELEEAIESTPPWRKDVSARLGGLCTACVTGNYPTANRTISLSLPTMPS